MMGILFVVLFVQYKLKPLLQLHKFFLPEKLFFGYMMLLFIGTSFLYSWNDNVVAGLYLIRLMFYALFFIYLYFAYQHTKKVPFNSGILLLMGISLVASFTQYFLYPDLRNIYYLGWDPHLYRMTGFVFDPPIAAALYGLLGIWVIIYRGIFERYKFLPIFLLSILTICFFLTYSRGAYIAALVTLFMALLQHKYGKVILLIIPLFLGVLFLLPKEFGEGVNLLRTSTIATRLGDYQEGIKVWQKSPILGIGYNRIRSVKEQKNTLLETASHSGASFHSSFLIILATTGLVGFGLFVWITWRAAALSTIMKNSILFTSILSITDNVLLHPLVLFLLGVFAVISSKKISHLSDSSR